MKTYTFYSDPGHSWLKVTRAELKRLDLCDKISGYSYEDGDYVYLEEDCDASLFLTAKGFGADHSFTLDDVHVNDDHPIRSMRHFVTRRSDTEIAKL